MSGGVMSPVPKDHPLMIAWEAYKATEDYANSRTWAAIPAHVDGSLWSAFERGFRASGGNQQPSGLREDPVAGGGEGVPHATQSSLSPTFLGGEGRALIEQLRNVITKWSDQASLLEQSAILHRGISSVGLAEPEETSARELRNCVRQLEALLTVSGAAHQDAEKRLTAELVIAKHHKALSLLGKSSWQEVVEEKLRMELAEALVCAEAAEADVLRLRAEIARLTKEIEVNRGVF